MNRLSDHSHLRNPLFTTKQCNWLVPAISREGKVIGTLYCPKDVWAEYLVSIPSQMSLGADFFLHIQGRGFDHYPAPDEKQAACGGFYCPAHFMRMLAVETAVKRIG